MSSTALQPRRSLIFAPGDKPDMFAKALRTGADIVCVDLEDAVAPQHKAAARERTLPLFDRPIDAPGVECVVRVNCLRSAEGVLDVAAILARPAPPPALMLTKVRTADEVRQLDDVLSDRGLKTRLHVIIETNDGLENAFAIARSSPRVDALLFGGVDMAADLRTTPVWDHLLYARSKVVHAAAGAGVDLIDVPYLDLNDMDGMRREAEASAALGFTGKGAIHPKQIPVLNEIFSPSAAEVERGRRIIKAFAESGTGLVVIDGKLIERPVLRSMERLVAIADATGRRATP
ncbi:MAG: HpcH/HpaI aldolase/citrate lyase family protein [Candidatus Eiseniibacteriota bacterium]